MSSSHLSAMYATKRRRRNSKSVRVQPKETPTKSNPSKRHRERLNAELDTLASLLPFDQSVLSKLDKLSILRLSVSYLRTKSYFQASISRDPDHLLHRSRELLYIESLVDGDLILQALNGFLLILTCDGEVFYASHTVETFLGFHQSDICHQSVYELVHSEDREDLQRYLLWNTQLPSDRSSISLQQALLPENFMHLERNFTVRFRCLLDNTSGFLRLDIQGRIKVLKGQNHKTEDPPLALFAVCTPFGPPSLLEMPQKESMFKSKHKLDLSLVSMDLRGKQLLGYSDADMANKGVYDLVHYDDLEYVANAHQELLKTGASGLIAYRLQTKDSQQFQWLQTSARLVYKNSKPDFILCTHRPLMEEEGRDLLGKRTMDFKVTYLDSGLTSQVGSEPISPIAPLASPVHVNGNGHTHLPPITLEQTIKSSCDVGDIIPTKCSQKSKKYKSQQIRDIITTSCRKRKSNHQTSNCHVTIGSQLGAPEHQSYFLEDPGAAAAAAAYNNMYSNPYAPNTDTATGLSYAAAVPQNFFLDGSGRFLASESLLHYRHFGSYYPDYPQYPTATCFPSPYGTDTKDSMCPTADKLYNCHQFGTDADNKYSGIPKTTSCYDPYQPLGLPTAGGINLGMGATAEPPSILARKTADISPTTGYTCATTPDRQSVLMWGKTHHTPAQSPLEHKYSPPSHHHNVAGLGATVMTEHHHLPPDTTTWSKSSPKPPLLYNVAPTVPTSPQVDSGWHHQTAVIDPTASVAPWRPHLPALG